MQSQHRLAKLLSQILGECLDSLCLNLLLLCRRDPFRAHRDHMRQMMRSFSEPYGGPLMPSIMDGRSRGREVAEHPSSSPALRDEHRVRTCITRRSYHIHIIWVYAGRKILMHSLSTAHGLITIEDQCLEGVLSLLRLQWKLATGSVTGAPLTEVWGHVSLWFSGRATPLASLDSYIQP